MPSRDEHVWIILPPRHPILIKAWTIVLYNSRVHSFFHSMALYSSCTFISPSPPSLALPIHRHSHLPRRVSYPKASLSSSSPESKASPSSHTPPSGPSATTTPTSSSSSSTPFVESRPPDPDFNYALANPNGNLVVRMFRSTESSIERVCCVTLVFLILLLIYMTCYIFGCKSMFSLLLFSWLKILLFFS